MKRIVLASALALLLSSLAYGKTGATAKADIINGKGESIGTATLKETSHGVDMSVDVSQLPPGMHAFHIHNVGKCDPPDFKSAGPHFNPENKKHGWSNPEGHHAGDLENLAADDHGKIKEKLVIHGVTLGDGPNSLFHQGGTAIVIHADPDDGRTDPAGNAGARFACGVITK